jgi:hypothetical protein
MLYKYPELFQYYSIEDNGLLYTFFENLKNNNLDTQIQSDGIKINEHNADNVALYVITYNVYLAQLHSIFL